MERLETTRLVLREMVPADVEGLHRLFSDPVLMRFWPVFTRADTQAWVEDNRRRYVTDGYGMWTVTLKGDDAAIGDSGMIRHEIDGGWVTGIGWHLQRRHWGKGYATEAALASRDYAFDRMGVSRIVATIHPENQQSINVATKIGMTFWKEFEHRRGHRLVYRLDAPHSA